MDAATLADTGSADGASIMCGESMMGNPGSAYRGRGRGISESPEGAEVVRPYPAYISAGGVMRGYAETRSLCL
jgi:hypothetical protein